MDGRRRCRDDTCIVLVHNRTAIEFNQTKGIVRIKNTDVIIYSLVGYKQKTIHVSSLHFSDTNGKIKQQNGIVRIKTFGWLVDVLLVMSQRRYVYRLYISATQMRKSNNKTALCGSNLLVGWLMFWLG